MKQAMLAGRDRAALLRQRGRSPTALRALLNKMVELLPVAGRDASRRPTAPLVGRVFKTISEPHVGDVTLFRLYTGDDQERRGSLERGARASPRS